MYFKSTIRKIPPLLTLKDLSVHDTLLFLFVCLFGILPLLGFLIVFWGGSFGENFF